MGKNSHDVILYPTVGSTAADQVAGVPKNGADAIPYKKTALTPNLGANDSAEDIRGGLGVDGLAELAKFVQQGGTLIGDGSTVEMLAEYGIASGVTLSTPAQLFTKGSIMRGIFTDKASPLAYGYQGMELPVYFSQNPVLTVSSGARGLGYFDPSGPGANLSQNVTPNAYPVHTSPWKSERAEKPAENSVDPSMAYGSAVPTSRSGGAEATQHPRVVMQFPIKADDILLSGMLSGGQALTRKALIVDVPQGKGHMVLFALRPFWRWQTQGSYFLGFNAILNWDHLDAGTPAPPAEKKAGAAE